MNIGKIAFLGYNKPPIKTNPPKLTGLDYSSCDDFVKTDYSKSEIVKAASSGALTDDMVEQMILKRIPMTLNHAKIFVNEHPEFCEEDVVQDLIEGIIIAARRYDASNCNGDINQYLYNAEKKVLRSLLRSQKNALETVPLNEASCVVDESNKEKLRQLLSEDIESHLSNLREPGRQAVVAHYGFDGEEPKTQKQIGKECGVTEHTINTRIRGALAPLRSPFNWYDVRYKIWEDVRLYKRGDDSEIVAHLLDRGKLSE